MLLKIIIFISIKLVKLRKEKIKDGFPIVETITLLKTKQIFIEHVINYKKTNIPS